jgi:hypothetical protein
MKTHEETELENAIKRVNWVSIDSILKTHAPVAEW